jgi:hypothetical protein
MPLGAAISLGLETLCPILAHQTTVNAAVGSLDGVDSVQVQVSTVDLVEENTHGNGTAHSCVTVNHEILAGLDVLVHEGMDSIDVGIDEGNHLRHPLGDTNNVVELQPQNVLPPVLEGSGLTRAADGNDHRVLDGIQTACLLPVVNIDLHDASSIG